MSGWLGKVHDSRVFKNSPLYDARCAQTFLLMGLSKVILPMLWYHPPFLVIQPMDSPTG